MRLSEQWINLSDMDIDGNVISFYLDETDELDKIAGLNSKYEYEGGKFIGHADSFEVNYYAEYDFNEEEFKIEICTYLYDTPEEIRSEFPDIADRLLEISSNGKNKSTYLELTESESNLIFEKFKDKVINECEEIYTFNHSSSKDTNFKSAINCIRADLEEEMDEIDYMY